MRTDRLVAGLAAAFLSLSAHAAGWTYRYEVENAAGVRCEKRGITSRPVQRRIAEEVRALRPTGFSIVPGSIVTMQRDDYKEAERAWKRRMGPASCRLEADGFRSESWLLR